MTNQSQTRRSFYITAINLLGAAIGAALALPAAAYLLIRPKSADQGGWSEVGELSQLKVGKPEQILFTRKWVDGWRKVTDKGSAWVVRTDQNNVVAFNPACTHLACPYHWDDGAHQFVCPCHDSKFSIDGKVVGGPAPRPLDRYVAKVQDGKVLLGSQVEQG